MGARRKARELALGAIFENEFSKTTLNKIAERILSEESLVHEVQEFFQQILMMYAENVRSIDEHIVNHSNNWKLSRMASVDRNLLRLGVCEIMFFSDIPKSVTINEYLEIAKKFGTEDSSSFINGILDKIDKPL